MSFTGDLEHLPIVDVIQLLHATRKSGILRVKSRKGESQLVFKDGYIVSANHLNNTVRIGTILVELNMITPEILDRALQEQENAGKDRKPLIVTLLENGLVEEGDAYKGLEQLIEMTVVEILTWKRGTFTLEVLPHSVADEYRYYPERMSREINVDTQGILMDALRIFDEKMRDGELTDEDLPEDDLSPQGAVPGEDIPLLSADDLGLADLDRLERKIPEVFTGLAESDPGKIHYKKIEECAAGLSAPEKEELAAFLAAFPAAAGTVDGPALPGGQARTVIFLSADELASHAVTTVCKPAGISVFATSKEDDLDPIIARSLAQNTMPILVFDSPEQSNGGLSAERTTLLRRQKKEQYPRICTIQLAAPRDAAFTLQAYADGVRAVLPRPLRKERKETFVADTIRFLTAFQSYLKETAFEPGNTPDRRLKTGISRLLGLREASEVALALLELVAGMCERSLTLIVRESELIAEKGIGIKSDKSRGATPVPGLRIPLAKSSLFRDIIEKGHSYYGATADEAVREHLFAEIGAPCRPTVLLLPMKSHGKTLALIYGDFGGKEPAPADIDLLEILASQAELVLENSLYRKRLEKSGR